MNDRSGLYGVVSILLLIGASVWGVGHEPMKAKVADAAQPASKGEVVAGETVRTVQADEARTHWEALTAEVAAYHAKGMAAPSDLFQRQMAAYVQLQGEMRRNVDALSRELSALRAQGTGNY